MAYTHQPHPRYQDVRYNTADNRITYTVVHPVTKKEATPSAITITIYRPGTDTEALSETSMSAVSGSDSQYEYSLDTTDTSTWTINVGYSAQIKCTIDSVVYYDQIYLAVVYHPLMYNLRNDDLWELQSELQNQLPPGQTGWEAKILAAENMIRTVFYQTLLQTENMHPSRVNGYAQLFEWHRYLTLRQIYEDLEEDRGGGSKTALYARREQEA